MAKAGVEGSLTESAGATDASSEIKGEQTVKDG